MLGSDTADTAFWDPETKPKDRNSKFRALTTQTLSKSQPTKLVTFELSNEWSKNRKITIALTFLKGKTWKTRRTTHSDECLNVAHLWPIMSRYLKFLHQRVMRHLVNFNRAYRHPASSLSCFLNLRPASVLFLGHSWNGIFECSISGCVRSSRSLFRF